MAATTADAAVGAALGQRAAQVARVHDGLGPADLCYVVRTHSRPGLLRTTTSTAGEYVALAGADVSSAAALAAFCSSFNQQRVRARGRAGRPRLPQ
jgi:hypothetical protein